MAFTTTTLTQGIKISSTATGDADQVLNDNFTDLNTLMAHSFLGEVADEAAMIALSDATQGAVVYRTDESEFYKLINDTPGTASNWRQQVLLDSSGNLDVGSIQILTDTASNLSAVVLDDGQMAWATDDEQIGVGDGSTAFSDLMLFPRSIRSTTNTGSTWSGGDSNNDITDGRDWQLIFDLTTTNAIVYPSSAQRAARIGQRIHIWAKECGSANAELVWSGGGVQLIDASGTVYSDPGFIGHTTDNSVSILECVQLYSASPAADEVWAEIGGNGGFTWSAAGGP